MPRSFSRFLSNRYNDEQKILNKRHDALLSDISNTPRNRKSRSTLCHKARAMTKLESNFNKRFTFHYGKRQPSSDWRQGDNIPIVVRRKMEEQLNEQLMEIQPISEDQVFSHTIWRVQMPDEIPVRPKIYSNTKERIITAVALPKRRCGRKPKIKIIARQTDKSEAIQPLKVEEPLPLVKKLVERRHIKQKGEQLTCSNCSRTFNHSWMLVAHMRVHTGERPFVCPEQGCQKSFSDRSNLRTHQRSMRHHNWEHQCGQCGKYFNQILYLNRHTLESCRKYLMIAMHRKT